MAKVVVQTIEAQSGASLFTLSEICQRCGVHAELVVEMVEYGVVEPVRRDADRRWLFAGDALARLHRAQRLRHDLQLDLAGVALSLELLDEIATLRRQVDSLQHQLQQASHGGTEAPVDIA